MAFGWRPGCMCRRHSWQKWHRATSQSPWSTLRRSSASRMVSCLARPSAPTIGRASGPSLRAHQNPTRRPLGPKPRRLPMAESIDISPCAIVWRPQCGVVLEFASGGMNHDPGVDHFVLPLGAGLGFVRLVRLRSITGQGRSVFQSCSVHPVLSPDLGPLASIRCVLWSRPAAREADRAIAAFLVGQGPKFIPVINDGEAIVPSFLAGCSESCGRSSESGQGHSCAVPGAA